MLALRRCELGDGMRGTTRVEWRLGCDGNSVSEWELLNSCLHALFDVGIVVVSGSLDTFLRMLWLVGQFHVQHVCIPDSFT